MPRNLRSRLEKLEARISPKVPEPVTVERHLIDPESRNCIRVLRRTEAGPLEELPGCGEICEAYGKRGEGWLDKAGSEPSYH